MNLFAETRSSLWWLAQVLRQFLRVVPGVTLALVVYLTVARIARLLAFLLPLKVILLAGSSGIPHYFHPFLADDQKNLGIVILSAASIAFYALTLFLEGHTRRLSDKAGADLMSAASVMSLVDNQRAEMQGNYARFMQIVSGGLFVLAGMFVLAVLDPLLAAYLCGLGLFFYALTTWALRGVTPLNGNRLADFITGQLGSYLNILSSVAFLSGFLIILRPFLQEGGANVLVAIICFMLLRQMTSAMTGAVRDIVTLAQKRQLVDTLVFPNRQFHPSERNDQRTLRQLFGREERERLIAGALAPVREEGESLRIGWLDTAVPGMAEFSIVLEGQEERERHFRLRVFAPRLRRMLENEDLLFRHVSRESVWAAPIVARFTHGEHECIIYAAGTGVAPKGAAFTRAHQAFVANLWSVSVPAALARTYSATHKAMQKRLTRDLIARMEIAVDTNEDADILARFLKALPVIRKTIAELPLCLNHPAFPPGDVAVGADGSPRVFGGWGQWSLMPLGAGLPVSLSTDERFEGLLAQMRPDTPDMPASHPSRRQLIVASACAQMERSILQGRMKAALAHAERVVAELEATRRMAA
jgi:hypothetical protein